jgi:hypothetical protein
MAQLDENKLHEFVGKMLGDLGGAFSVPTVARSGIGILLRACACTRARKHWRISPGIALIGLPYKCQWSISLPHAWLHTPSFQRISVLRMCRGPDTPLRKSKMPRRNQHAWAMH